MHKSRTKKDVDDQLDKNTTLRFNQSLQNYLKASVSQTDYNLTLYNRFKNTDTTISKDSKQDGYLLQQWNIECIEKIDRVKITNFVKPSLSPTPTGSAGARSLPPIGDSFMYIKTSSNSSFPNVYCSFERTDIIQTSKTSLFQNS